MKEQHGGIAVDDKRSIAFVTGRGSNSLAAVSYADPGKPELLSGVVDTDATDLNLPVGAAFDDARGLVLVSNHFGHSITVVSVVNASNLEVLGSTTSSTTYMHQCQQVCLNTSNSTAYTIGRKSHSIAIVSYANPSSPYVISGLIDAE